MKPGAARQPVVLAGSTTVARSALWNLLGRAAPIAVALVATPYLINALGPSRWGVFTIALSLIGIFGIFDFGIGRALTRSIAERLASGQEAEAASLVMTGVVVLTGLGVVSMAVMALLADRWVLHGLNIEASLHDEVLASLYVLCVSAPLVILNATMWGVIAAFQKFRAANLINIPIMVMYYVGPVIALQFRDSLTDAIMVLVACRLVLTFAYGWLCLRIMPSLRAAQPHWRELRPLLHIGGWMTVSNVTWPLLGYVDRFVIASVLSATATGYYVTPSDLVTRFSILTLAISTSAYPAMAGSFRVDPARTARVFRHSILAIVGGLFPLCSIVIAFSTPLLTLWIGADFAAQAAPVLCWLGFGVLATSVDMIVAGLIDAIGRPDVNAKISLMELVVSVPLLIFLLDRFGIEGAAIAWTVRCFVDLTIRLVITARFYPAVRPGIRLLRPTMLAAVILPILPLLVSGLAPKLAVMLLTWPVFLAIALRWTLSAEERIQLRQRLRALVGALAAPLARQA